MNFKHKAIVKDGQLKLEDRNSFKDQLKLLEGKEVDVTIAIHKKRRSNNQNRYYWGVVVKILCDELGYMPDELHDAIKYKFLAKNIDLKGEKLPVLGSTNKLNTAQFEDLMAKVRAWASRDLQIFIPEPNEIELPEYY